MASLTQIFILTAFHELSQALKINHLWLPEPSRNGTLESAILDCDYSLDERDKGTLEVKWYFRHRSSPIYQWVPPNPPQALGGFSEYLNLDYKASSDDLTKHRALHLKKVGLEVSGYYECKVSSIYSEDRRGMQFIIYTIPRILDMNLFWRDSHTLNASCVAEDAHPEPKIRIFLVERLSINDDVINYDITDDATIARSVTWNERELYSLRKTAILRFPLSLSVLKKVEKVFPNGTVLSENVVSERPERRIVSASEGVGIACEFDIPGTRFRRRVTRQLPGTNADSPSTGTSWTNRKRFYGLALFLLARVAANKIYL